jgi:hypothetical protein
MLNIVELALRPGATLVDGHGRALASTGPGITLRGTREAPVLARVDEPLTAVGGDVVVVDDTGHSRVLSPE